MSWYIDSKNVSSAVKGIVQAVVNAIDEKLQ